MEIPVFSLGQPSRRTGLGGYSMKTTVVGGIGFVAMLLMFMAGQRTFAFTVIAPITVVLLALVTFRVGGRSVATSLQMMFQDLRRRHRGEDVYIAGRLSQVPGGTYKLPGTLARTELLEGLDGNGNAFGVIYDRPRREATVLLDTQLSGQTAMTQDERNAQTANWGRWLAGLSMPGDIVSAATVVATRPGSGALVRGEVAATVHDEAPWIARQVQAEAAATLVGGVPEIEAHIAVTIKVRGTNSDEEFLDLLGTRLPGMYEDLQWAGILARPMAATDVIARVHARFCPSTEADLEAMGVQGIEHNLQWEDAGPQIAVTKRGEYCHEQVKSVTWEMGQAPRSTFEDHILQGLIAPHPRVERKRVCLVYRPFDAGKGASKVEAEHKDALVAANSSKKIRSASAELRLEHTEAARRAQARGAQLGQYSLFVTATIDRDGDLRRLRHDVEQLGAGCSIVLRPMTYQQDAGFITSLGVGQIPWSKSSTAKVAN